MTGNRRSEKPCWCIFSALAVLLAGWLSLRAVAEIDPPSGLLCELMEHPEKTIITDARPDYPGRDAGGFQTDAGDFF